MGCFLQKRYFFFLQEIIVGSPGVADTTLSCNRLKPNAGIQILSSAHVTVVEVIVLIGSLAKHLTDHGIVANQLPGITGRNALYFQQFAHFHGHRHGYVLGILHAVFAPALSQAELMYALFQFGNTGVQRSMFRLAVSTCCSTVSICSDKTA